MTRSSSGRVPAKLLCCHTDIQQCLRPVGEHLGSRSSTSTSTALSTSRLLAAP